MKRIPGTMFLPDDIGEIEWLDEPLRKAGGKKNDKTLRMRMRKANTPCIENPKRPRKRDTNSVPSGTRLERY